MKDFKVEDVSVSSSKNEVVFAVENDKKSIASEIFERFRVFKNNPKFIKWFNYTIDNLGQIGDNAYAEKILSETL